VRSLLVYLERIKGLIIFSQAKNNCCVFIYYRLEFRIKLCSFPFFFFPCLLGSLGFLISRSFSLSEVAR